mmetsp:Transcript_17193/g.38719  ORF Transcript_17193/g.38719 Transcript_17193/m.38719 type:complete len:94 (+) Transcript_17193:1633-1914(+)
MFCFMEKIYFIICMRWIIFRLGIIQHHSIEKENEDLVHIQQKHYMGMRVSHWKCYKSSHNYLVQTFFFYKLCFFLHAVSVWKYKQTKKYTEER